MSVRSRKGGVLPCYFMPQMSKTGIAALAYQSLFENSLKANFAAPARAPTQR